jgi:hypothetical protein
MAGSATLPALMYTRERTARRFPLPVTAPPLPELPIHLEPAAPGTDLWAMVGPFLTVGAGAALLYGWAYWLCFLQ